MPLFLFPGATLRLVNFKTSNTMAQNSKEKKWTRSPHLPEEGNGLPVSCVPFQIMHV